MAVRQSAIIAADGEVEAAGEDDDASGRRATNTSGSDVFTTDVQLEVAREVESCAIEEADVERQPFRRG